MQFPSCPTAPLRSVGRYCGVIQAMSAIIVALSDLGDWANPEPAEERQENR
jgi:hypothetical protein